LVKTETFIIKLEASVPVKNGNIEKWLSAADLQKQLSKISTTLKAKIVNSQTIDKSEHDKPHLE